MIKYFCKNCNINVESSECSICGARTEVESKLYWCSNCNIPVYDEVCPICGCEGEYFASDARPVFPEERLLIEIMIGKPFCFVEDSVWNGSGNRYYVNGKKIPFSVTNLKHYDPNVIREKLCELKDQNTYVHFDKMIAKWIKANSIRYDYITSEAKSYIAQYSKKYLNDDLNAAFVSFSGGKDSTVVSDLVRKATGNPSIIHIFGNTTLEFPQTYEYVERFRATNKRTPMLRAENKEQDFFNLCETFGPPSRTLRWCCTIFKTGFIGEKIKTTFSGRKTVLTFYGIRRNESASRNTYERSSQGKKITQQLVASPIIDWMDYDIWLYLLTTGIDFNEAYRLGYTRVGCWCCPNNSGWSQFLASIYMPEQYYVQDILRAAKGNLCIVVDEAHNFGAKRLQKCMLENFKYRLALSATLERHHDEEGTQSLYNYFKKVCITFTLEDAIKQGFLTPYYYHPVVVNLEPDELQEYIELTEKIINILRKNPGDELPKSAEMLLIKRARIIAGARNKLHVLEELMEEYKHDNNILVYCGATKVFADREDDYTKARQEEKTRVERDIEFLQRNQADVEQQIVRDFTRNAYKFFALSLYSKVYRVIADAKQDGEGIPKMHFDSIEYILQRGKCICGADLTMNQGAVNHIRYEQSLLPPQHIGTTIREFRRDCQRYETEIENYAETIRADYIRIRENANQLDDKRAHFTELSRST